MSLGLQTAYPQRARFLSVGSVLRPAVCVALAAIAVFVFWDAPWGKAFEQCSNLGPWVLLVLLPHPLGLLLETTGWRQVIERLGGRVAFWRLFAVRLGTEALGQTLPAGVVFCESLKPWLLIRHCGMNPAAAVAATVHRKWLRLAAHALYVLVAFFVSFRALKAASRHLLGAPGLQWVLLAVAVGLAGVTLVFGLCLSNGSLAMRAHGLLTRLPLGRLLPNLSKQRGGFFQADVEMSRLFELRATGLLGPVLFCGLAWSMEALESIVILTMLGSIVDMGGVFGVDVAVSFIRQVFVMFPAGVGVQDLSYVGALSALRIEDAAVLAAAFVVLKRVREVFWSAIGCSVLGVFRVLSRRSSSHAALQLQAGDGGLLMRPL